VLPARAWRKRYGAHHRCVFKDALLDEAEQFGFDVVAGELERELPGALTVTRLRVDFVDGVLDGVRRRPVGVQVDPCARPLDAGLRLTCTATSWPDSTHSGAMDRSGLRCPGAGVEAIRIFI
jgi:hypothetical protein